MIAEVMVPNISPIIKIDIVFEPDAATKTATNTHPAPRLEAITKLQLEKERSQQAPQERAQNQDRNSQT